MKCLWQPALLHVSDANLPLWLRLAFFRQALPAMHPCNQRLPDCLPCSRLPGYRLQPSRRQRTPTARQWLP
jgi:hypothetical protein